MNPLPDQDLKYRRRVNELVLAILKPVNSNYERGPVSRVRALEALNALAIASASVILGCEGVGGEAEKFFYQALAICLREMPVDGGNLENPNPPN